MGMSEGEDDTEEDVESSKHDESKNSNASQGKLRSFLLTHIFIFFFFEQHL